MSCACHLNRRAALRLLMGGTLVLGGCFEGEKSGPVEIKWDRDVCRLCNMMISDARFAAQVRGGPDRRAEKFDDIGCAINWLNEQPWAGDAETEIWVAERDSTRDAVTWLDARKAHYLYGATSPMNYNFAALAEPGPGTLTFEQMTGAILADAPNHICPVPVAKEGS